MALCPELSTNIWTRCLSHCTPTDLSSLALVSRYFRALSQPLIFERQYCLSFDSNAGENRRSAKRLENLVSSAHVASVKTWVFIGKFDSPSASKDYPRLLEIFTRTLHTFRNLQILQLRLVPIDELMQKALVGFDQLQDLALTSCDLTAWTESLLTVAKLKLGRDWPDHRRTDGAIQPLRIVSGEALRELTLEGHQETLSLIGGLGANGSNPFHNLITLSVQLSDALAPAFLTFLARCPQLTKLDIPKSTLSALPHTPLPPTTIPLLHYFKGPRFLAAFFASARPIHTLELLDGGGCRPKNPKADKDVLDNLADIARICPGLLSLSITSPIVDCLRITAAIAGHWPALRDLCFVLRNSSGVRPKMSIAGLDFSDSDDEESDIELDGDAGTGATFCDPARVFGNVPAVPTPDVLVPGHLYTKAGSFPPSKVVASARTLKRPTSYPALIDAICSARVSIFTHLEDLRFTRESHDFGAAALPMPDQHRAILALERQLPDLCEVEFQAGFRNSAVWRREKGGQIWDQKGPRNIIASSVGR
ncbi:hypothetical protein B0H16DRAFT_1897699 [Mycena metata]|uniref:F-box domain-containing protein n=1 Tax=Mycena metata TaxID=1033252 RepID=A0AAD7MIE0_9AGAR|nr:hypothetical protein B0H16DRAFT_1897699 [Mycena metata]